MLQPIHTPIQGEDRITALATHLTTGLAPTLLLTTLGVRRHGAVEALVIVHMADGTRETLSASQARDLATGLRRHELGTDREADFAVSLDEAADQAERQASAILLGMDAGQGVTQPRAFGDAR